jgi:flagellar biosynthesis/type III secretory pathway M-ring protein FliF/YscJ
MTSIYVVYIGGYLINKWIPFKIEIIVIASVAYFASFLIIWFIVYFIMRNVTKKLNDRLNSELEKD